MPSHLKKDVQNWRIAMPLEEYRKKRNFRTSSEPAGRIRRSGRDQTFVVQKHDASHLHYDFRLAINGMLVSWAVPKGPTLDGSVKRFATMTEDHPLEYADFEGVIPEGYGAGTVMVWDRGSYEMEENMPAEEQLARGEIKIILRGKIARRICVDPHGPTRSAASREVAMVIDQEERWACPGKDTSTSR
jgi:bifunctional non-homologous end joining protein LigD